MENELIMRVFRTNLGCTRLAHDATYVPEAENTVDIVVVVEPDRKIETRKRGDFLYK